ncbi:ComEA family DNA-binding protein [Ramlibacter sp.]|uniref:ComEA family DNA-binding protein n=1 Tax=Ramlibacter sp. TaxID=1917967 RepID=UPI003D128770
MRHPLLIGACLLSSSAFALDVNTASEADLDGLKGLGPASTRSILQAREKGAFKDWADLMARVKGLAPARAAKLSAEGMTVNGLPLAPVTRAR